jgi:hypothetical protein
MKNFEHGIARAALARIITTTGDMAATIPAGGFFY